MESIHHLNSDLSPKDCRSDGAGQSVWAYWSREKSSRSLTFSSSDNSVAEFQRANTLHTCCSTNEFLWPPQFLSEVQARENADLSNLRSDTPQGTSPCYGSSSNRRKQKASFPKLLKPPCCCCVSPSEYKYFKAQTNQLNWNHYKDKNFNWK